MQGVPAHVFPAFRPDGALKTETPVQFNRWIDKLGATANLEIASSERAS